MDINFLEFVIKRVFTGIHNDRLGWHLDGKSSVSILKDYDDVVPYLKYASSHSESDAIEMILSTIKKEALRDDHLKVEYYLRNEGSYSSYIFTDMMTLYKEPWYPFKGKFKNRVIDFTKHRYSHLKKIKKFGIQTQVPCFHLFAELNSRLPYILNELGEDSLAAYQDIRLTKCLLKRVNTRKTTTIFKGLTNSLDFKIDKTGFDETLAFCKKFQRENYRHFYVYDTLADNLISRNILDQSISHYADYINNEKINNILVSDFKVIDDLTDWIVFLFKLYHIGIAPNDTKRKLIDLIKIQKQRICEYAQSEYVKTKFVTLSLKLLLVEQGLAGQKIDFTLLEDR